MQRLRMVSGSLLAVGCAPAFALVLLIPAPAFGQGVQAGLDFFTTDPSNTEFDFADSPIPADFFFPGSDPWTGTIELQSLPLPESELCPVSPGFCPDDDLSEIDTIVERLETAYLPGIGQSDTVAIELISLSLVSIEPITVTYNGGQDPELWDVEVCNSSYGSPQGEMVITRTHMNGGMFNSDLPVRPLFRFTRQMDSEQRYLDGASAGITDTLGAENVKWIYTDFGPQSCRSNFCTPEPFTEIGLLAMHGVFPSCYIETLAFSSKTLWILAAVMAVVGIWVLRRVTRQTSRVV